MANIKGILLVIGGFLFVLILFYSYLGGFKATDLRQAECTDVDLVGVDYLGIPQEEAIGDYFRKVEAARGENPLHTIYYIEPEGKRDTLHVFIGYESKKIDESNSTTWTHRSVQCDRAIVARLEMSRFVMPGPDKTKKEIQEFADENGLTLTGVYIDKIISSDLVEVWAPVNP